MRQSTNARVLFNIGTIMGVTWSYHGTIMEWTSSSRSKGQVLKAKALGSIPTEDEQQT